MAKRASRGEQTKSESLTVRLSPRMKFGLELLAREQRRTASAVIESLLDQAIDKKNIDQLWHPSEAMRAIRMRLTLHSCHLMNFEETRAMEWLPILFNESEMAALRRIALRPLTEPASELSLSTEEAELLLILDTIWQPLKVVAGQSVGNNQEAVTSLGEIADKTRRLLRGEFKDGDLRTKPKK